MKVLVYKVKFKATNRRGERVDKYVISPIFKDGKHITEEERKNNGIKSLLEEGYEDIEYINTKTWKVYLTERI